jgi:hypothetical protein
VALSPGLGGWRSTGSLPTAATQGPHYASGSETGGT